MIRTRVRIRTGVSRGLCGSCNSAFIRVDEEDQEVVECQERIYTPLQITKPLKFCSNHSPKGQLNQYALQKMAWIITKDKKGKLGFEPPKQEET